MCRSKVSGGSGLSKTLILKGMQCQKALYLSKYPPDFTFPPQPDLEAIYRMGTEVGLLAQQMFPGGVEVPFEGLTVVEQIARTRQLIDSGTEVIYEASFNYDGIFVKVDILVKGGDAWQIYEVKMTTVAKEVNSDDVAIQYYVLTQAGLPVSGAYLVHINNQYVRQGEIDVQQLFVGEDVLANVRERQAELPQQISGLRATLQVRNEPDIDIGPHCTDPYACDFIPYCWRHIPENSIFDLKGRGIKKFDYYYQGIIRFEDIPLARLTPAQRQQVVATLHHKNTINIEGIRAFIDTLWYPLCYLDFETFHSPIPLFDKTRPYQQVPFQFSIHIQKTPGAEPKHFSFLAEPGIDPRRKLIEKLLSVIPADACILTYNQAFEKGVLRELSALFYDLSEEVNIRLENLRDLIVPFRKRDVYLWQMAGSYSIKQVLPAMVPELSYAGMEIADGLAAMQAYHVMCALEPGEELDRLRAAMQDYCELDTFAMVMILAELMRLVDQGEGK